MRTAAKRAVQLAGFAGTTPPCKHGDNPGSEQKEIALTAPSVPEPEPGTAEPLPDSDDDDV